MIDRVKNPPEKYPTFKCNICEKEFLKQFEARHKLVHKGAEEKVYKCKHCDLVFSQRVLLINHERSLTGDKPFTCKICMKAFSSRKRLTDHEKSTHSTMKPWKCRFCSKTFATGGPLRKHEQLHNIGSTRAFQCEICLKSFKLKAHLKTHEMSIHLKIRRFNCDICGKNFLYKAGLNHHLKKIHSDEKPHKCSYCNRGFTLRTYLVLHERTHTGEKPYHCRFCDHSSRQKSSLRRHEMTHNKKQERIHKCGICPKRFLTSGECWQHRNRLHSGKRPFTCHLCPMTFTTRNDKTTHTFWCQTKARTALLEEGFSEEEAYIAVGPPLEFTDKMVDSGSHYYSSDDDNNPFKLKECRIRLQRMTYIELGLRRGFQTFFVGKNSCGQVTNRPIR